MELTHSFTVPASVEETWATFMDLQAVGSCFPGAAVTEVTDDGFSGTVKVKLGPIALQYAGSGSFVERDDATHHAVIEAKGKDKRGNGTAGATVTIRLSEADGGGTTADVVTDLAVTGKPAQFGRGVMQDVSDKLLQQFVACIEGRIGSGPPEEEAPAAPTGAAAAEAALAETASAGVNVFRASVGGIWTDADINSALALDRAAAALHAYTWPNLSGYSLALPGSAQDAALANVVNTVADDPIGTARIRELRPAADMARQ